MLSKKTWVSRAILVAASCFLFAGVAVADQLKIMDATGKTRSMTSLSAGTTASVSVALKTSVPTSEVELSLTDTTGGATAQTTKIDAAGKALFLNVTPGTYKLTTGTQEIEISDVQILKKTTSQQGRRTGDDKSRRLSRALYIGGASALGAGALALGISSSGSGSSRSGSVSGVGIGGEKDTDGLTGVSFGGDKDFDMDSEVGTANIISPRPNVDDAAPPPDLEEAPDPAPTVTDTTTNTTPTTETGSNASDPAATPPPITTPTPTPPAPEEAPPVSGSGGGSE